MNWLWALGQESVTLTQVETSSGRVGLQAFNFWIDHPGQHSSAQRRRSLNCECSSGESRQRSEPDQILEGE